MIGSSGQTLMRRIRDYVLDWSRLGAACSPCSTNGPGQAIYLTRTWFVTLTTLTDRASIAPDGSMTTKGYLEVKFSQPVAGFGLTLSATGESATTLGIETFDIGGASYGKQEESFASGEGAYYLATAPANVISRVRLTANATFPHGPVPEPQPFTLSYAEIDTAGIIY